MKLFDLFLSVMLLASSLLGQGLGGANTKEVPVSQVTASGVLHPYGIKVRGNEVWLADTGGDCIRVFNKTTGALLRQAMYGAVIATPPGTCDGSGAAHPYQLDFDASGNVWVGDNNDGACKIYKLDPSTLLAITSFGSCGTGNGQFAATGLPFRGLVIYNNEIYVSDNSNTVPRVQVFDMSGTYQRQFAMHSVARSPFQLAIYDAGSGPEIYVAEGTMVEVYSLAGVWSRTITLLGSSGPGIQKLGIINSQLYASNATDSLIHVIDPATGVQYRTLGVDAQNFCIPTVTTGPNALCNAPGQFNNPGESFLDTSVSPPILYVTDIENYRYQTLQYPFGDPTLPAPTPSVATGTYTNDQTVTWTSSRGGTILTCSGVSDCSPSSATNPVSVTATGTHVCARATRAGWVDSSTVCQTYTLQVATPTSSPALSTTVSSCSGCLTFSTTTTGAEIRYNTTGPTASCSDTLYTGALSQSVTTTYYWVGCKTNYANSAQASGTLTIGAPYSITTLGTRTSAGAISIGTAVAQNASVLVACASSSTNTWTATDTKSNTYTPISQGNLTVLTAVATTALSTSDTISVTPSGSSFFVSCAAYGVVGAITSSPLDQVVQSSPGLTTTITSPSLTPSQQPEIAFAAFYSSNAWTSYGNIIGSAATGLDHLANGSHNLMTEWRQLVLTTAGTATMNIASSSSNNVIFLTLKGQ